MAARQPTDDEKKVFGHDCEIDPETDQPFEQGSAHLSYGANRKPLRYWLKERADLEARLAADPNAHVDLHLVVPKEGMVTTQTPAADRLKFVIEKIAKIEAAQQRDSAEPAKPPKTTSDIEDQKAVVARIERAIAEHWYTKWWWETLTPNQRDATPRIRPAELAQLEDALPGARARLEELRKPPITDQIAAQEEAIAQLKADMGTAPHPWIGERLQSEIRAAEYKLNSLRSVKEYSESVERMEATLKNFPDMEATKKQMVETAIYNAKAQLGYHKSILGGLA